MRAVLFDLGHTLEVDDVLLPGAHEALRAVGRMEADGEPVRLALLSDYRMPDGDDGVSDIVAEYVGLLERLGIRDYFEPVAECVTLSTELGVFKPHPSLFRLAVDRVLPGAPDERAAFVTENGSHVAAARALGMTAIQVRPPGASEGELPGLLDVPARIAAAFGIPAPAMPLATNRVRLGRARLPSARGPTPPEPACGAAASWVRLGRDVLLFSGAERPKPGVAFRTGSDALEGANPRRDHLHVVRQKGRLFQRLHPNVNVLQDSGRFLVVELPPDEVPGPDPHGHTHFEVAPLLENEVLFSLADVDSAREKPDPAVEVFLETLDAEGFRRDLEELVGIKTRESLSEGYQRALEWARDQLAGHTTRVESFAMPGGTSANLVAGKPGTLDSDRDVILVTAHLDSVNLEGGPGAPAPGADDNGSGAAGVLAIARTLMHRELRHDVRFVLFGGEEQGLHGSRAFLAGLTAAQRGRIRAVVNMDMIGAKHASQPGVLLESSTTALWLLRELTRVAATYTDLQVQTSTHPFASDHVPFLNAGIPAVLTIEATDELSQDFVHSPRDTLERVDDELAIAILRMNTAWVVETASA